MLQQYSQILTTHYLPLKVSMNLLIYDGSKFCSWDGFHESTYKNANEIFRKTLFYNNMNKWWGTWTCELLINSWALRSVELISLIRPMEQ
jgi:hypothetical protein